MAPWPAKSRRLFLGKTLRRPTPLLRLESRSKQGAVISLRSLPAAAPRPGEIQKRPYVIGTVDVSFLLHFIFPGLQQSRI